MNIMKDDVFLKLRDQYDGITIKEVFPYEDDISAEEES